MKTRDPPCAKGQLSTMDALFGLAGLTLVLMLSLTLFTFLYGNASSAIARKDMELKSFYAGEELLSRGDPANWQALGQGSLNNYGLAREDGVLDEGKLAAFNSTMASNYSFAKERLGLSKYNLSLQVSDYYSRASIYSMGSAGAGNVLAMQYVSTLNGSLVLVQLQVSQ